MRKQLQLIILMLLPMVASAYDAQYYNGNRTGSESENLDITKIVGSWQCTASIDKSGGKTYTDYMKNQVLTVNLDGTYSSTSKEMGNGTYTIQGNTFTAKSSSGRTFTATVTLDGDTMIMDGKTSDGITFKYTLKRVGTNISDFTLEEIPVTIYDLNGIRISQPQRGVNIIRMGNGTTRKVLVK